MPMVPTEFAPSVAVQPSQTPRMTGPMVTPMQNDQPATIDRLGQASQQLGSKMVQIGQTIGDRVQAMSDDALTKQAETQFLSSANKVVTDYTHTLGQDAVNGFGDAQEAVVKAKADAESGLTNDIQRRMFNYVATEHLNNYGKTLSDHQFQQNVKFSADAANDRADSMIQEAANSYDDWQRPDGNYALYRAHAVNEALQGAQLMGLPADSPQAKQLVKEKTTELARGVLTRMMDNEQYDEAQNYYGTALAAGDIDERSAEQLGNAVMEGHNSQKGKDLATEAKQDALGAQDTSQQRVPPIPGSSITTTSSTVPVTDQMGSPRPGGRVHDGIDIAVPVGTKVQAPADGTVSKVWNDDKFGGGLSMEITYPNGSTEGFAHLSATNYQPGQQVTQGAVVALTGKTGNATGPTLHWAMKDADGQWVDPRAASPATKNASDFTDPDMLQKSIDYVNDSDSTQRVKDAAVNQLKADYGTAREIQSQQYQKVKQQVVDTLAQNGGNMAAVPADLKTALHPSDLEAFQQDYDDAQRKQNEVGLRASWIENPAAQTPDAVKEAYQKGELTDSGYLSALKEATDLQSDPQKVQAVSLDNEQVKATLINNHLPQVANPEMGANKAEKDALQAQQVLLFDHVKDVIGNEQVQTGKPVTRDRKQQIIDQAVMDQIHIGKPGAEDGTKGGEQFSWQVQPQQMSNAYVTLHNGQRVNPSYIPPQVLRGIMNDLQTHGVPSTMFNVATRWDQLGRPVK